MYKKASQGFTLIEIMISIAIFTIVMTVGVSAVLNANAIHKVNQSQRSLMDNLNFVMEDMSRNIRLGSNYFCLNTGGLYDVAITQTADPITGAPTNDCQSGGSALALEPMEGRASDMFDQVVYVIASEIPNGPTCDEDHPCKVWKSTDGGETFLNITPTEVVIDPARSGFSVFGTATSLSGDVTQPAVLIRLAGTIRYKSVLTPFDVQTSITQRATDF